MIERGETSQLWRDYKDAKSQERDELRRTRVEELRKLLPTTTVYVTLVSGLAAVRVEGHGLWLTYYPARNRVQWRGRWQTMTPAEIAALFRPKPLAGVR